MIYYKKHIKATSNHLSCIKATNITGILKGKRNMPYMSEKQENDRNLDDSIQHRNGIREAVEPDVANSVSMSSVSSEKGTNVQCETNNFNVAESSGLSDDALLSCSTDSSKYIDMVLSLQKNRESNKALPYSSYSKLTKTIIFIIITFCGFLGPLAGNIFVPALPFLRQIFNVTETTINATVSVFMGMFSVGPIFWGMFADSYGRKRLYIVSITIALVANVLLSVVPVNIYALFVLRVVQAFGTSGVIPLGLGTVRDIVSISHRGRAVSLFMMGPNAGPVLAPIIAGLILRKNDEQWRWLFGTLTVMTAVALVLVVFVLPETLRSLVGNGAAIWEIQDDVHDTGAAKKPNGNQTDDQLNKSKSREKFKKRIMGVGKPVSASEEFLNLYPKAPKPHLVTFWLMVKDVRVVLNSVCSAIIFAVYYGFSVTFAYKLKQDYDLSNIQVGIAYCCPGVALVFGTLSSGYLSDLLLNALKNRSKSGFYVKENRLMLQLLGLLICCCGSIGYGWSIDKHLRLVVVFVFSALSAFGMTWCSNASITYMIDIQGRQAATAIAINNCFRNLAAAISAVIINQLSAKMGFGWCFTGLGCCVLISAIGIIVLIHKGRENLKEELYKLERSLSTSLRVDKSIDFEIKTDNNTPNSTNIQTDTSSINTV